MKKILENVDKLYLFFSITNMICYLLHFTNFNTEGVDYISWLVFSIVTGLIAYYNDKHYEKWYAAQVLFGSFLLFAEKNFLSIGLVGLAFLFILLLSPLTYQGLGKITSLGTMYVTMFLSMSVLLRVIPIHTGVELYSVKMSVFVLPLFILGALVVYAAWDIYKGRRRNEEKCIHQLKLLVKKGLVLSAVAVGLVLSQLLTGESILPTNIFTKVFYYIQEAFRNNTGLYTSIKQEGGVFGLLITVLALCFTANTVFVKTKSDKDVNAWQFELMGIVFLLQSICLPQSVVVVCLYMIWVVLGYLHRRSVK